MFHEDIINILLGDNNDSTFLVMLQDMKSNFNRVSTLKWENNSVPVYSVYEIYTFSMEEVIHGVENSTEQTILFRFTYAIF